MKSSQHGNAKTGITTKIIEVDKDIADNFLKKNIINRPINQYRIKKYADQMRRGEWKMNGESIIVGTGGELLNGQHRLLAISSFGLKIRMLFCFNVEPDTFDTIDTGDGRSGADVLAMKGIDRLTANALSVCIRLDILMKYSGSISGQTRLQSKITPQAISMAEESNPRYLEAVEFVQKFPKKNLILPGSAFSFLAYRFFRIDESFSDEWLSGLISGIGIESESDTRVWIRNMFWREMNSVKKRSLRHKIGIVIRAWHLASNARTIKYEGNLYRDPIDAYKYITLPDDMFTI